MNVYFSLMIIALLPVITSTILYLAFVNEKLHISRMTKQVAAGLIFGFLAIISTEFGVPFEGAIINARDSAPLCAGLIFGPWAGIIAGLIGGLERWLCVFWGGGYYTRLACSISTILAGFIAAGVRVYLFDDELCYFNPAIIVAMTTEVMHMLMIFITNINDVKTAFYYVEACTIPMVLVNSLAVGLAVLAINLFDPDMKVQLKSNNRSINAQFQNGIVICVALVYLTFTPLGSYLESQILSDSNEQLLRLNLADTVADVEDRCDEMLLRINRQVVEYLAAEEHADLQKLAASYNVEEINVVDRNGIIIASTNQANIGFDMGVGDQSKQFMPLLEMGGPDEFVQSYQPIARDSSVSMKYSAVRSSSGFVQIGLNQEQIRDEFSSQLENVASNRRIGENGLIMILDEKNNIISCTKDYKEISGNVKDKDVELDPQGSETYSMYQCKIRGVPYYYMFTQSESYSIVGFIPGSEADFSKIIYSYLDTFKSLVMFGVLFLVISTIIKKLIVDNIQEIDDSLEEITQGNLDTVVDVRTNKEFTSLSDGINVTVDALKMYIDEANRRIDSELKYASEIQLGALPSTFPAFPEYEHQFDLYALMDPAREVGGDFYDFYLLDDHTLVFLVADVSGKGIPASLFMMRAKTTLKTYAENHIGAADIFTNANFQLCEGNDVEMFVTAWMGFLDLRNGELTYVNAGHNRPLLRRAGGEFEYLYGPCGFILGGMEGIVYKEQHLTLQPGDEIFLYTDGVVEATSREQKLYGEERLKYILNLHKGAEAQEMCRFVKEDVDLFYNGAEQFDDITELSVQFKDLLK